MFGIMENIFNDILTGKIDPDKLNDLSKKFSKDNKD